jgi:hypothetical protein
MPPLTLLSDANRGYACYVSETDGSLPGAAAASPMMLAVPATTTAGPC